jgi:hypothetical protein
MAAVNRIASRVESCTRLVRRLGVLKAAVTVEGLFNATVKKIARCGKSCKRREKRLGELKAAVSVE